jgi:hypothetical protein
VLPWFHEMGFNRIQASPFFAMHLPPTAGASSGMLSESWVYQPRVSAPAAVLRYRSEWGSGPNRPLRNFTKQFRSSFFEADRQYNVQNTKYLPARGLVYRQAISGLLGGSESVRCMSHGPWDDRGGGGLCLRYIAPPT